MKTILLLTSTLLTFGLHAQEKDQKFITYVDTINKFSIDIPTQWRYGVSKAMPDLELIALRQPADPTELPRDNFNINLISTPGKDLSSTFSAFINSIKTANNFKIIDRGDTVLNGTNVKWIIETHDHPTGKKEMVNYDLVSISRGKTYIVTLVTFKEAFQQVKPLFDRIVASYRILD